MNFIRPDFLFGISLVFYILAALAAFVFRRGQRFSTLLCQSFCSVAAVCGATAALVQLLSGKSRLDLISFKSAIPYLNVKVTMDELSAFFLLLLSILVLCVSIYTIGYLSHYYGKRNVCLYQILYIIFILSMIFVFTAGNAIFFFMAWEIMAIVSYFLVVFESEQQENRQAGLLYVVFTHIGTAFLMIAFMIIFKYTNSFDLFASSALIPKDMKNILFILFLLGFGAKAGVIPLHIWLPHAHPAAPGSISALMSGVMIKTAVYGMLRFVLFFLGAESGWWGALILVIGMISAVLGVMLAFIEQNIKKILAYSSIENMGIIFIGLGISFIGFSKGAAGIGGLALAAALLHCFNHALFKGSLFLGVGSIHYATHTKNIENLGGLIKVMPLTSLLFLGGALSISAIVPFNGFISEWLIYQSIFAGIFPGQSGLNILFILAAAALAIAGALAAATFIKLYGISFLGLPRSAHAKEAKEVPLSMNIGIGILTVLCLIAGLFPTLFIRLLNPVLLNRSDENFSLIDQLQGNLLMTYSPLEINSNTISPLAIMLSLIIIVLVVLVLLNAFGRRWLGQGYMERTYGTWDCGFNQLNSRMQYSGTAFSKPIKIVFKILFKSSRNLKVTGNIPYHPDQMEYSITTESVFEKYIYIPVLIWVTATSRKLKFRIQTGSVHTYLFYIFIAVLALMLYNAFA